jgi:hypothetical protein
VTGGIVTGIRLGFDDPTADPSDVALDDDQLAQQVRSDDRCIPFEPRRRQRGAVQSPRRSASVASITR